MWLVWIIVINRNKGVRNFLGDNAIGWQRPAAGGAMATFYYSSLELRH